MYDEFGIILRIETTTNDVTFFKHHRTVEQRDGTRVFKLAPLEKSIYSLGDLRELMRAANRRYIEWISSIDDPTIPLDRIAQISRPAREKGRSHKGFNLFSDDDQALFEAIAQGEQTISGIRNKDVRQHLAGLSVGQVSRRLERLRVHGLIKKIGHTYKYYLTKLGYTVVIAGLELKSIVLPPLMSDTA
jgi:hypothetical protein